MTAGECEDYIGVAHGFLPKSSVVTAVGRTLDKVTLIEVIGCTGRYWGSTAPVALATFDCPTYLPAALARYCSYCAWSTDKDGNAITVGVVEGR